VDSQPITERTSAADRMISDVRITGVDAALARTLAATLETRTGDVLGEAPIAADLRRLWALGVVDDARIELDGDRVIFVLAPRPRIGRVVMPRRDPSALRRFDLLAGAAYEPQRIARIAAAVRLNYVREGHLDARVDVQRWHRGDRVDVCVAASPGPKITIRSITFPGAKHIPQTTLLGQLHGAQAGINRVGGIFDADALEFDEAFLLNEYWEVGRANVSIGDARVRRTGDHIDIEVPIHEGPEFTIGTTEMRIGDGRVIGAPRVAIPLAYGEQFKRSRVQAAREAIAAATGAEVIPLTHIDHAHHRIDITFELTWRYPWDALRLWLSR
jgi:outer membrane protein insertion porin family